MTGVQTCALPIYIGCLSSLRELNLSGNNFVCLPESVNQLSNLLYMDIVNCTSLRLLPELPLNIGFVVANGCSKLEALPDPLEPKFGFKPMFDLLNCFKLVENQGYGDMFLTMLRSFHQVSLSNSLSLSLSLCVHSKHHYFYATGTLL